jgi:hypothetical protein
MLKIVKPATREPVEYRLLFAMVATAPDRLPAMVNMLVEQRDLDALRLMLESALLPAERGMRLELGAAISPLANIPAAAVLVKDWLSFFELDTQERLDNALHSRSGSNIESLVQGLLALGANPNGTQDAKAGTTALGRAFFAVGETKILPLYLAELKRRDQMPLFRIDADGAPQSLFDHVSGNAYASSLAIEITFRQALDNDIPQSWRREIGRAMLANMTLRTKPMFSPTGGRSELDMHLISHCYFDDPADWIRLLAGGVNPWTIPTQLSHNRKLSKFAPGMIAGMLEAGVDLDAVLGKYQRGKTICPLLFCAVGAGNVTLLKILLEAGADPCRKIDIYDKLLKQIVQRDAFELSPPGSGTTGVLNVWRAHRLVQQVGEQAAQRHAATPAT